MSVNRSFFGKTKSNENIDIFTLSNNNGMKVSIINYGATIVSITAPDKSGKLDDIVLGYDNITSYENGTKYIGATLGRCANRIENGVFKLNGVQYTLYKNDGENHSHGGLKGFNRVIWNCKSMDSISNTLKLFYISKDGEEGYPGNLKVIITYTLTDTNSLKINYHAVSDKDTVVNLSNHVYFNLSGNVTASSALNHKLMLNSDTFTEINKNSVPTGKLINVSGTPMDFRTAKTIAKDINSDYYQVALGDGYDHNFVLNSKGNIDELAAKLIEETTGRVLKVYTTKPCLQFYTSNFLNGKDIGKNGTAYEKRSALCFETQYVPNAINNPKFTSPLLKANEEYNHTTIFEFSTL